MANRVIKHCYDCAPTPTEPPEVDKNKSISELSRKELWDMLNRLRDESEVHRVIKELKRNSGERESFEKPFEMDTKTPINQLYHYGIKNQKWGIRRFQNADGTRTTAGKRRSKDAPEAVRKKQRSEDHIESRINKKKGIDGLSNAELRKLNERLQLEDAYKKLTPEKIAKSENWVKEAIKDAAKATVKDLAKGVMLGGAKLLIKQLSPELADAAFSLKEKKEPAPPAAPKAPKPEGKS